MSFLSGQFVCFLVAVWVLFLLMPAKQRWLLLLIASYIFYGTWSIPFIGVILLSAVLAEGADGQRHSCPLLDYVQLASKAVYLLSVLINRQHHAGIRNTEQ